MNIGSILPVVRHVLQFAAGYLASSGIITASMTETVVGVGVGLVSILWWFITKEDPNAPAS